MQNQSVDAENQWDFKMKVLYTSRLFFEKYSIKIIVRTECYSIKNKFFKWDPIKFEKQLKDSALYSTKKWLDSTIGSENYKVRDYYIENCRPNSSTNSGTIWNQMIYVNSDHEKDAIIKHFGDRVIEVTQPFNKDHKDKLEIRNVIVVRSNLLYNKYQYVVYFKYDRNKEIINWLRAFFADESGYLLNLSEFSPRIYLHDNSHLTTIKLMWQEKINHIKTVQLMDVSDDDTQPKLL